MFVSGEDDHDLQDSCDRDDGHDDDDGEEDISDPQTSTGLTASCLNRSRALGISTGPICLRHMSPGTVN